ncbi:MAG: hypothetical protein JNG86_15340 [Verrucomicrobiaceae bacterium]|nr:hypothetical protein [Verrucomicrobiaceae bacterium]
MKRLLGCLCLLSACAFAQTGVTPSRSERIATLQDTRINESSGLARSLRDPETFWTINDSGGEPCVFAIDIHGHTRAKVRLPNAVNFDWEDLCGGLDEKNKPVLYIGDIGDNFRVRQTVQIYRIPEPELVPDGARAPEIASVAPVVWHVSYPDGPHNAEGLLVHPVTRRIHILTKSDDGKSALYAFPLQFEADKPVVLEKIVAVTFTGHERVGKRVIDDRMCTGAAFSPDGSRLVASTYSSLYEWSLPKDLPMAEAMAKEPARLVPDLLRQLEAVCYGADSKTLWITSEHLPAPLVKVTRP